MLRHFVGTACLAFAVTLPAIAVRAQNCDPRYDRGCPYYQRPSPYYAPPSYPSPYYPGAQPAPVNPQPPAYGRTYPDGVPQSDRYGGYAAIYGPIYGEPFPIPAVQLSDIGPQFLRTEVLYRTNELPGTIIIDPRSHFLYFLEGGGRATRYGVGVGRQGFGWSGIAAIHDKQEWPDWYPPKEMVARQPELRQQLGDLEGGLGMPGGPRNPLGSRAMYLWQGNKDTLYRIHGTVEPWTIGKSISSGCIRMINQDVIDLYTRAAIGAKVIVLGAES